MSDTAKSCKAGYYYCFTDKKCKKIPLGWHVGRGGYLSRDDEDDSDKKNGNGNGDSGNGNGGSEGGNGGGNGGGGMGESWSAKYKKSIDCNNPKGFSQKAHCQGKKKKMNEEKHDHEHEMIRRQMDTVTSAAKRLKKKVGNKGEGNVKAWVQSKITKAADYIDTAADYMDSDVKEENIDEAGKKCWKGYKKAGTQKLFGKTYNRCVKANEEFVDEAKDETEIGITGLPIPKKKRSPAKQHEFEKERRKNLGTNVGGKTYKKDVTPYYNPRVKEETCPVCHEEPCKCEANLEEGNKSGDTSLRDWFSKSRSSDGTPGWVQLGGKYAGKPCARQPGQKTKPKCGSSKMKRNLNKKEEEKAFRRKNREDGNPNRKGKAKNVATEEAVLENQSAIDRRNQEIQRKQIQLDRQKIAVKRKMAQMDQKPTPNDELSLKVRESAEMRYCPKCQKNETRDECVFGPKYWDTYSKPAIKEEEKKKKRDACYHKVKSRYSVWPSAYASGALVKCRKVGAKNWGNSKKEEVEFEKVVEFLYVEGFAKSVDDAAEMAMHLSETWVNEILNG